MGVARSDAWAPPNPHPNPSPEGRGAYAGAGALWETGPGRAPPRPDPSPKASGRGRLRFVELLFLGRALQCRGRGLVVLDRLRHRVEVAGAYFALVLDRGEAALGRRELGFLQLDESAHLAPRVAVRQVEHGVVER